MPGLPPHACPCAVDWVAAAGPHIFGRGCVCWFGYRGGGIAPHPDGCRGWDCMTPVYAYCVWRRADGATNPSLRWGRRTPG